MASFSLKLEISGVDDEDIEEDIKYGPPEARTFQETSPNYNSLPRGVKDEKPLIGPRSSEGNIKILYPAQIEGYDMDHNTLAMMESMGLPTGFSFGHMEPLDTRQTRGVKKTFYCQTCLIELNSEDTMTSHLKGVRHMKKQLALEEKQRQSGQPIQQAIVPIANPEPTKKKVPIRLQDKIRETSNPIVGLDYIKEFIAVSDSEMEPHYECSLCESQGQANGMFSHLNGQKHRQQFMLMKYGNDPVKVRLSQADLLRMAGQLNENVGRFQDRITTRYSDEEYPWPAGKEPWSVLKGGTGIAPDAARNNYGKKQARPVAASPPEPTKSDMKPVVGSSRGKSPHRYSLPSTDKLVPPKNLLEAEKILDLAQQLLLMAADYSGLKHMDRSVIRSCFAALAVKTKLAGGMKRPRSRSSGRQSMSPAVRRTRTRSPSTAGSGRSVGNYRDERPLSSCPVKREKSSHDEEERYGNLDSTREFREGSRKRKSFQNERVIEGRGYKDRNLIERRDSWSSTESSSSSSKRNRSYNDLEMWPRDEEQEKNRKIEGRRTRDDTRYYGEDYRNSFKQDMRESSRYSDESQDGERRTRYERRPREYPEESYYNKE